MAKVQTTDRDAVAPTEPATGPGGKPAWAMNKSEAWRAWRAAEGLPPPRRRWQWIVLVLILLGGGAYYYYTTEYAPARAAAAEVAAEAAAVAEASIDCTMQVNGDERAVIEPQVLRRDIKVIGTIEPSRQIELSSQVTGRVDAVAFEPGEAVEAGDLLVQIDVETLSLDLNQARSNAAATRAQLVLAETQLERVQTLIERGVTTASSLDEAETNVAGLRANIDALDDQVAAAELRLANATVRAPLDGIVSVRGVDPGQFVSIGSTLMTVVDMSTVEFRANASVSAGGVLRPGQDVAVTVDGIPNRVFEGRVARINPVAEEGTRTIPVYVRIDNADGALLGGMFATGQVTVEEAPDALAVPADAIRDDIDGIHVLVIEDGKAVRHAVETGGDWAGGLVQVTSGLETGQIVVTAPLPALVAGSDVELVE